MGFEQSRSVQNHLLDGEQVIDYFLSRGWAWVSTDRRLVKYRQTDAGHEEFEDISYDEISGISITHEGRNDAYLYLAIIFGVVGVVGATQAFLIAFLLVPGLYFGVKWYNSEESYFEFKGSGIIRQEPERWRIAKSSVSNEQDLNDFVRTVRERL